jgi:hypothetical protein
MRLDVPPFGGAGRTVAQVAGAIVEYLEGGVGDPRGGLLSPTASGPGARGWWPTSATGPRGRDGGSDRAPRHSGLRAPSNGAGAGARRTAPTYRGAAVDGAGLVTAHASGERDGGPRLRARLAAFRAADTARLLGLTRGEIDTTIENGELHTVTVGGDSYAPDREVTLLLDEAARPAMERIRAGGDADDWLSGPRAARLLGVSRRWADGHRCPSRAR